MTVTAARGPAAVERPLGLDGQKPPAFGSDLIVEQLRELGCAYLPMNPGSSFRGLHDSVVNHAGNSDPQLLLCHHEEIAVSLAHGYAKATRRPAFAAVHDLVGLMHASMAVYDAWADEIPLVLLGGGGPADTSRRRAIDWVHTATAQAQLVRDYVKWDAEPIDLRGTLNAIGQAAAIAATPPHGPVYVTMDVNVQEQPLASGEQLRQPPLPAPRGLGLAPDHVDEVLDWLLGAERPVIAVGPMGYDPTATEAVTALADALDAACLDVDHATVVPTDFELNCTGDRSVIGEADVLLALGVRDLGSLVGVVPSVDDAAPRPRVIDVGARDLSLKGWSENFGVTTGCQLRFVAHPVSAARSLADRLAERSDEAGDGRRDRAAVVARHQRIHEEVRRELDRRYDDQPIAPARLVAALWETVRDLPWLLTLRNTRTWPTGVWKFADASDYLGHSGGAGVGYGPGGLVGGALGGHEQGRFPVAVVGDGDLLMAPGAIWTAVHYQVPLLLVVNDNSSFYNDEEHQYEVARMRGRPIENSWIGMRMDEPGVAFADLARAYGASAAGPITDPDDLLPTFAEAREHVLQGGVAVVHVRTAPT